MFVPFSIRTNKFFPFAFVHSNWFFTTTFEVNPGKWVVYDSLNDIAYVKSLKSDIDKIERSLDEDIVGRIEVNSINMQQQTWIDDCGLFALACAVELAYNIDPAGIQFEQSEMRTHYDRCVDSGIISAFPQSKRLEKISQKSLKMDRK
jgi:hypothetical protein